jgi:hypothetical protein
MMVEAFLLIYVILPKLDWDEACREREWEQALDDWQMVWEK